MTERETGPGAEADLREALGDVMHEFRAPLTRLKLAVQLAGSDETREQALTQMRLDTDRLTLMADALLSIATGDPDPEPRIDVSVVALVREVTGRCAIEADAARCRLESHDGRVSDPVVTTGERETLERAVEHLVRNAIQHAPPDSIVSISVERSADEVAITVRDRGPGVPADDLPRLTEPFFRVASERKHRGIGLGLTVAQRAAIRHAGRLEIRNAEPGLEARLVLPLSTATR